MMSLVIENWSSVSNSDNLSGTRRKEKKKKEKQNAGCVIFCWFTCSRSYSLASVMNSLSSSYLFLSYAGNLRIPYVFLTNGEC